MALRIIGGKLGGGKSHHGVKIIAEELLLGERLIVTNFALLLPELSDYLARHASKPVPLFDYWRVAGPGELADRVDEDKVGYVFVPSRIRLLETLQLVEFYRHRHIDAGMVPRLDRKVLVDARGAPVLDKHGKPQRDLNPVLLDFSKWSLGGSHFNRGVVYHLDEVSLFYSCRKWSESPEEVPFYLQQHRKLRDDIYVYSAKPESIDNVFRTYIESYIHVQNLANRAVAGFRLPSMFRWREYSELISSNRDVADHVGWYALDAELKLCYKTAAGVGVVGGLADTERRKKGRPWWQAVAIGAVALVLMCMAPRFVMSVFSSGAKHLTGGGMRPVGVVPVHPDSGSAVANVPAPIRAVMPKPVNVDDVPSPNRVVYPRSLPGSGGDTREIDKDVQMLGWEVVSGKPVVALSDGSYVSELDGLETLTKTYCVISGRIYVLQSVQDRVRAARVQQSVPGVAGGLVGPYGGRHPP